MNTEKVKQALSKVNDPELGKDLITLNMVHDIKIDGDKLSLTVMLTTPACPLKGVIEDECKKALSEVGFKSENIKINMGSEVRKHAMQGKEALSGINQIIAISSGKGGVGKTTVSVNIAIALSQTGARVGLLDADITGPNVPIMMGNQEPPKVENAKIIPKENYGIKYISMGVLVPADKPVVWRGPMLDGVIRQFLRDVVWGELDYLIVDLPPGTGDAQLTICQAVPLAGGAIVTTPQDVALLDSRKSVNMFKQMRVPILGVVENMSYFICPKCDERTEIFSYGGGETAAKELGVPFLGRIPIELDVRVGGDSGKPITAVSPSHPISKTFKDVASKIAASASVTTINSQQTVIAI
ncbi:MAG: Mrp/NBP35 family ATP-binding protein [Candidatus Melainabacteria bacterium]|nr:Mrp/NBP35 family ATP-binding protein [Candidatus Melainabacteria bacterium]